MKSVCQPSLPAGLSAFGIAASNIFGICTGIFLLGYGLVEVPRSIWRSANIAARPAAAYRRVGVVAESLEVVLYKLNAQRQLFS